MPHTGLPRDHGLDDQVVDPLFEPLNVVPLGLDVLVDLLQRPLVALASAFFVLILLIIVRVLVYCVVRQVHEHVAEVLIVRRVVLDGGEAGQALFENVEAQRVDAVEEDVNAQVKL